MKLRFDVVVEEDEGAYYAHCPALPGLHVDGLTEQEVLENAKEGIQAYLHSLQKHDDPIPVGCIVPETSQPRSLFWGVLSMMRRSRPQTERQVTREILIAA